MGPGTQEWDPPRRTPEPHLRRNLRGRGRAWEKLWLPEPPPRRPWLLSSRGCFHFHPGNHGGRTHVALWVSRWKARAAPASLVSCRDFALKEKLIQSFTSKTAEPGHLPVVPTTWRAARLCLGSPDMGTGLMLSDVFVPAIYCILSRLNYTYGALYKKHCCVCVFLAGTRPSSRAITGP